jgi:hypothetical protein
VRLSPVDQKGLPLATLNVKDFADLAENEGPRLARGQGG